MNEEEQNPILSQADLEAFLGRPLSTTESDNIELYLELAVERVKDILCFTSLPKPLDAELKLLIARCFDVITQEQKTAGNQGITNKKVEDFSISYDLNSDSPMVFFLKQNRAIILKYSECQAKIRTGDVRHGNCVRCI